MSFLQIVPPLPADPLLPSTLPRGLVFASGTIAPIIFMIVVAAVLFGALLWVIYRRTRRRLQAAFNMTVLLVMVPKHGSDQQGGDKPQTTEAWREDIAVAETLFSAIGGLTAERGITSWLFGRKDHMSLEIVAAKGLISFYVAVPKAMCQYVEQQIEAQYPQATIEEVHDYNIFVPRGTSMGAVIKFQRPFVFPLKTYRELDADPMATITNTLSRIGNNGAAIQLVVRSAKRRWHWYGKKIASEMHQGKTLLEAMRKGHPNTIVRTFWLFAHGFRMNPKKNQGAEEGGKMHTMTSLEQEMAKRIEQKTSKAGLDVNLRVIVSTHTKTESESLLRDILNTFTQYNLYQYGNSLVVQHPNQTQLQRDFIYRHFRSRQGILLNTEELASLYHFPSPSIETPNIRWLRAKKAAPPVHLPEEGIVLGRNTYRGKTSVIRIAPADRQRHVYVIGSTGAGKTVIMQEMAKQDIANGQGVCIVDPHGGFAEDILENIPKERADDVIYFDPSDVDRPIGLNMLEARTEAEKDFVCQEMIAIFYKLVTDPSMIGPMFEHNMRNAMLTLMADEEYPGTMAEIPRMFSDAQFQKYKVEKVTDPMVRAFWQKEMAKTSDFHKSEMLGYLISKVGRFIENSMMRNIIGQPVSGFNFREIMDSGKILICNLSKGKIGEINANLLGLIIVSKLQMAAFGRAEMAPEKIRDFYLYVDEFQNFITDSIATILSEARKYKLNMTMAHQYMGQLVQKEGRDTKVRDAVLGNVGTIVSFRIGVEDAEILAKQFEPVFNEYDLVNIDRYHAYVKLLINNTVTRPFDIDTLPPTIGRKDRANLLKQLSRLKYGRDRAIVESEILERSQLAEVAPAPAPTVTSRL